MEVRRNSRTIVKSVYNSQKRVLALLLTAAMIFTNVGTGLDVSYGGTADQITFQMKGADLVSAVEEAVLNGHSMTEDDLDFTNGKTAEFEKVFFNEESGAVYEVYPEMEGGSMETELRVFVRLPEDADDMYMVTGDEEIILLYVNNGGDAVSCNTEVIRVDDGVEKVKKTKRVTIRSYEDAFGDEEVDLISKPAAGAGTEVPETTVPEEGGSQAETSAPDKDGSQAETTAPDKDGSQAETTVPEGNGSQTEAAVPEGDGSQAETTVPEGNGNQTEATVPEADDTASETSKDNGSAEDSDGMAGTVDESKTEGSKDHSSEGSGMEDKEVKEEKSEKAEPLASISRHIAPVVTEKEAGQSEAAETRAESQEKEETRKETVAREKDETKKDKETADAVKEETEKSTAGAEEVSKETAGRDETTESSKEHATDNTAEDMTDHTTEADDETAEPGTDETGSAPADSEGNAADGTDYTSEPSTGSGTAAGTDISPSGEPQQETTEAVKAEEHVKKAGTSDLAGMGYCSTAKVYTTTLNQLKALEDFNGYEVVYSSYPDASARILEGPRGVMDGESLTFGVKTQTGYSIDNVTVNDEMIEADTTENNEDGSQTAWYIVPEVYEEQNVEIYTLETMDHPAFDKSVEVNGVTIRITAPEGVLPLDTDIQAEEITEQVASAVTEKVAAEYGDDTAVSQIIAYDINLTYNGLKLDNSWADLENRYVTVSFSGDRIARASKEADQIEILHVETPTEVVEAVSAKAELEGSQETGTVAEVPVLDHLTADNISVDSEGRQEMDVSGDASVGQIDFLTDHFSAFTVVFKSSPYLLIGNELSQDSVGAETVEYTYQVGITDSRTVKNEVLYILDGDSEEVYSGAKLEVNGDTNTYTFSLKPGNQVKISNIGLNAKYEVIQNELQYNDFLGVSKSLQRIDWTQNDTESSEDTSTEESFPYGYDSAEGAYGSLIDRASALLRAFSKCKSDVERKELLHTTRTGTWNDQLRVALLNDHGLGEWPFAVDEGFGEVAAMAQGKLDQSDLRDQGKYVDLVEASRLNIYFRIVAEGSDKLDSPGNMEIVPYLSMNRTDNNNIDNTGNWTAFVAYNSKDKNWYQYLSKHSYWKNYEPGNFELHKKTADSVIKNGSQKDNWHLLTPGNLETDEPDKVTEITDGSFMQSGFAYNIKLTFKNCYSHEDAQGGANIPGGGSSEGNTENQPGGSTDNPAENQPGGSTDNPTGNPSDGSSGGSGGSGGGGSTAVTGNGQYQGSAAQDGPGVIQSMIEPSEVPLAALPTDGSAAGQAIAIIDDGEIPMAAIPKTGNRVNSAHELSFILSGVLLAVYTALARKKKTS